MYWIEKKNGKSEADVSLVVGKDGVNLTFRNGGAQILSKTDYVVVAIDKDKLYFKEANSAAGYKLTKKTKGNTKYCKISNKSLMEWCRSRNGGYRLHLDTARKLYYIDTIERI